MDGDARLVRKAATRVAVTITAAVSVLVVVVLFAAYSTVFSQVPLAQLVDPQRRETSVDIDGLDIVVGGALIGIASIAAAALLALIVTRRAVRPLIDTLRRQRQFVADASHELRTPLAVLDSRLQLLQRSLGEGSPHKGTVAMLRDDSRALIGVVSDLLESLDTGDPRVPARANVAEVIESVVSSLRVLAERRGVEIESLPPRIDLAAAIPAPTLTRCLTALVDNALKHSPDGGVIVISAKPTGSAVRLTVSDQGPGIRGIDPSRVFERFARSSVAEGGGGSSRSGFGIGLALVYDTVSRYGGNAEVLSTSELGTSIELTIPAAAV